MAAQINAELSHELHNAFSEDRYDDVLALAADDIEVVAHSVGQTFRGKQQFRDFFMSFKTALPDLTIRAINTIAEGDHVAVEFVASGTHTGPLMTPGGAIPASNNQVKLNVCEVHQWKDGKLSRLVNYQDAMSLMVQVGALPAQTGS
jgi:steroid delta-isomerase-like uncharacterized protein